MGNKDGKPGQEYVIPEEEWEKEDNESSPETMTIVPRTFEELPTKVKEKLTKSGITEQEIKDNLPLVFTIAYFNNRKEFEDLPVNAKKGKCPCCPKKNILEAKKVLQVPTKHAQKSNMEFLDKGGFGAVFSTKIQISPSGKKERVAVKKLPHKDKFDRIANYSEIYYSSHLDHPNIVKFKAAYLIPAGSSILKDNTIPEVWMAMEFLQGGTLNEASKIIKLSEKHVAFVAREVSKALKYIHEQGFAHRDLKSQNVMLSIDGQVKLIDMGLMCDFRKGPRARMLGSPYWIPPEMIRSEPHSFQVDVWSMAVCLLELMNQRPPLYGNTIMSMFTVATKGLVSQIPENMTPDGKDFLTQCLQVEQEKRAMPPELLKHKWVTQPKLEEGIVDILRNVFLNNAIQNLSSF
jgi:serine/threonine protein kinase